MKDSKFTFRISEKDLAAIRAKAAAAGLTLTEYITRAALGKKIVVTQGLPAVASELKAIGRNLNQLTMLANSGRVAVADLEAFRDKLGDLHIAITEIQKEMK